MILHSLLQAPKTNLFGHIRRADWIILGAGLLLFLAAAVRLLARLPLQAAGWLTFAAMLLLPGYLVTRMLTGRLNLDELERLAIAFPVGVAVYALPGLAAIVLHLTYHGLYLLWLVMMGLVFLAYLVFLVKQPAPPDAPRQPWTWAEICLLLFLAAAFALCYSTLTTYAVDGDLFTFLAKVSEEMTGRPMNNTEPIFGSGLGPGVRSEFNQFSPIWTLWSYLSQVSPVDITAYVSRAIFGLWTILAAYLFGKEAGGGSRRLGLLTASIQMLVYLAAPFIRADNAGTFYLQRTNADKFTISVTMLPVIFGMGIVYLREGRLSAWLTAAVTAFAISTIHPLIASMAALGLGAFGCVHLLLHLTSRVSWSRVAVLAGVAVIAMVLPLALLVMSRGSAPLAPTYPTSFEGWSIGKEMTPALPFKNLSNLDWYGPIPDLKNLTADQANTPASPFLIWRYVFNMRRQRLIIYSLHRYISDPSIVLEPPYLLAFLTIPFLLFGIRSHLGAQLSVGVSAALIFTMYNPIFTPMLGQLVVPWLLWRMVWMLPFAFMIGLVIERLLLFLARFIAGFFRSPQAQQSLASAAVVVAIAAVTVAAAPAIRFNLQETKYQLSLPSLFPVPAQLFARLDRETQERGPAMTAANQSLSVTIPVYAPRASVIGHRVFNTSEIFPADMQDVALQRLIDQDDLMNTPYLTTTSIEVLKRYQVAYIITASGTNLDFQLRLSPQWFEWLIDDQSFSLYRVKAVPTPTESILGNTELSQNHFDEAMQYFESALQQNPDDLLAMAGQAGVYRSQGQFGDALVELQKIEARHICPTVQYRLGELYAEMGKTDLAVAALKEASQAAPSITRYQLALGDVCQRAGNMECARAAYESGYADVDDEVDRLVSLGRRWLMRGNPQLALEYYEKAIRLRPSQQNLLSLASTYQALEQYDRAEENLLAAKKNDPFSPDISSRMAGLDIARGETEAGIAQYRYTVWLEELQMQDSTLTRLTLIRSLTQLGRNAEAKAEIDEVLRLQPYNTSAYISLGTLYIQQNRMEDAIAVFQKALSLDPTQATAYLSLRDVYQQQAALDENLDMLEQGVMQNPEEPRMFMYLGNQLQRLGNTQAAISANQLALNLLQPDETGSPVSQDATNRMTANVDSQLAAIYEDQGDFEKALNYYHAAAAAYPANLLNQAQLADALRRRYDLDGAEEVYRQILAADPGYIPAMTGLADLYAVRGDSAKTAQYYQQAVQTAMQASTEPQSALTSLSLYLLSSEARESGLMLGSVDESRPSEGEPPAAGEEIVSLAEYTSYLESESASTGVDALAQIYRRTNQIDQAVRLYETQIAEGQDSLPSTVLSGYYSRLAGLYSTQGELDRAMTAYWQAAQLNSGALAPQLGLANTLMARGDPAGAVKKLEEFALSMPGVTSVQLALARAVESAGDAARAMEIYTAVARDHPGNESANLSLARALQRSGRLAEAEALYQKMTQSFPGSAAAYTNLARLYASEGHRDEAQAALREAIRLDKSYSDAYLAFGDLLSQQGQLPEAVWFYAQVLALTPLDAQGYTSLARAHQNSGEVEQAIEILQQAAAILPGSAEAWNQLAGIYREQDQPDQAEAVLLQALANSSNANGSLRLALADLYQAKGQDAQALNQFRLAVEENPTSVELQVRYANELYRQGQLEEADAYYQKAEQSSAPTAAGYRALSAARSSQGQAEAAMQWLEKAVKLAPNDPISWQRLAQLQSQSGQAGAALASLQQAAALSPGQAQVWVSLGQALIANGQRETGLQDIQQAITVQPNYLPAYQALVDAYTATEQAGQIDALLAQAQSVVPGSYQVDLMQAGYLIGQEQWDAAAEAVKRAIARAPGQVEPYLTLGSLYSRQSLYDQAIAAYQQALERDSRSGVAYTNLSALYRTIGNTGQAEAVLQQGAAAMPGSAESWIQLAGIYREQGRPDRAEAILLQALAQSPSSAQLRTSLADLYQSLARGDQALEQVRLAAEANPSSIELQVRYANALYAQGQVEQAEALYQQAEQNPDPSAAGYRSLAAARAAQGQIEVAFTWLDQALQLAPNDFLTWLQLAGLQAQQGQTVENLASLRQAVALAPDQAQAWVALGQALIANAKPTEGFADLEHALVVQPDYVPAYQALVDVYGGSDPSGRLDRLFAQARSVIPNSYQIDLMEAGLLADQGRWKEAEALIRQAIAKAPGQVEPYISLGSLFSRQSLFNQAIAAYLQALQVEPLRQGAANGLTNIYLRMALTEEQADYLVRSAYLEAIFTKGQAFQPGLSSWAIDQEYP